MSSLRVSLLGATGQTGRSILEGLLAEKNLNLTVEALVRPSSAEKPSVKNLAERGVTVRIADLSGPSEALVSALTGVDILISAITAGSQLQQRSLASAAKAAGVKRFLPCGFTTVAPAGDVMKLRDDKEEIYAYVKEIGLPYTVVDVGYWYQISFPRLPSGKVDYAMMIPNSDIHGDGEALNILTDKRDIGRFVARIIADARTVNQYVYTWGEVLTENEIFGMLEDMSGEKIERNHISNAEVEATVAAAKKHLAGNPEDFMAHVGIWKAQYAHSKYVRRDNQPKVAKELGYLDARELYPDFKPISFRAFLAELLDGKGEKPYVNSDLF